MAWKVDCHQPWFWGKPWLLFQLDPQGEKEEAKTSWRRNTCWGLPVAAPVQGKHPPMYSLLGTLREVILWQSTDWTGLTIFLLPNLGPECYFGGPLLSIDIESNWVDLVARNWKPLQQETTGRMTKTKGTFTVVFFNWFCKTNLALWSFLCSKWEQTVYCLKATALTWAVPVCIMRLGLPFMHFDWSVLWPHWLFCILNVFPGFSRRKKAMSSKQSFFHKSMSG